MSDHLASRGTSQPHRPARTAAGRALLDEIIADLAAPHKTLPCKLFYDERGSELFERITTLPEYYPTRTERAILTTHAGEMIAALGGNAQLVELGAGSGDKTRLLLDRLAPGSAYIPVDISAEFLLANAARLAEHYPHLRIEPLVADYTRPFTIPPPREPGRRVFFFPGSTIGNFDPDHAAEFLARLTPLCVGGGGILIGVDLIKQAAILDAAYNDAAGVTAEFNMNLLRRLNREFGADFDLEQFTHRARFNRTLSRVEMHLVSTAPQRVHLAGNVIIFRRGETIHTENSYKYTIESFAAVAARAGLRQQNVWTDPRRWFSVQLLLPTA